MAGDKHVLKAYGPQRFSLAIIAASSQEHLLAVSQTSTIEHIRPHTSTQAYQTTFRTKIDANTAPSCFQFQDLLDAQKDAYSTRLGRQFPPDCRRGAVHLSGPTLT
jgi:hypothetical protein